MRVNVLRRGKMGVKRQYLISSNTSEGFVSFAHDFLKDIERVYILKGGPGCGKSTFMKRIGNELLNEGFSVDFVNSPTDANSIDGIFIHDIGVAIVNGTAPGVIDPKYPGAIDRLLDFGEYWDIDYLRNNKIDIKHYTDEIETEYKELFKCFKKAKLIHDRWEKEYLIGMDFKKAEEITKDLIENLIKERKESMGKECHRFSGAMTPQGNINFYELLIENIKNRYIVKGRPGTGKSTMTRKLAKAALEAGYDVEYYHCAFDPDSIDMIIIPEMSFAILDGTAPHIFDPGEGDNLVDMFECIDTNIVHEHEDPIKSIEIEYANEIANAKDVYARIKELNDKLEEYYISATDFNDVNALRIRITKTLKEMKK
jgi:DNA replication protein DnaC